MKEITIVWLDRQQAKVIVATPVDIIRTATFESNEPERPSIGSTPEYRLAKEKARQDYYKRIAQDLQEAVEIVLFGPDNTKEDLLEYLNKNLSNVFARVIGVETSRNMPEEKIIARGRKYI